jgi:L-ascorbate metabolism protein UlaG (beta-lactamase superfamily)
MDISYIGHATFELSDGSSRVLVDPFLAPNNPAATWSRPSVESRTSAQVVVLSPGETRSV